jgi:hypothetical protein
MQEQLIEFETAKLAKEKGFEIETLHFYTKPNSKMFGIDEKGRSYPIKNTFKKLYKCGEQAALNIESVYLAPTQSLLQKWLREIHNIHIEIQESDTNKWFGDLIYKDAPYEHDDLHAPYDAEDCKTYEEALEICLLKALELI